MDLSEQNILRLQKAADKQEIKEVIFQFARAIDRSDKDLIADCFHPDGTDDHGVFKGTASEFCEWVMGQLAAFERTQHIIANTIITLDGDKAASEAYFMAHHLRETPEGRLEIIAAGRYLDRLERRDGKWRIAHRHAVFDWNRVDQAKDAPPNDQLAWGQRGNGDPSYAHLALKY